MTTLRAAPGIFCALLLAYCELLPSCLCLSAEPPKISLPIKITSKLSNAKVCVDPLIDFSAPIQRADPGRVLDPNSIQVVNLNTGQLVPHSLSRHFRHGDRGRVRWVVEDPEHVEYSIRFHTAATRPVLQPTGPIPLIGVGDLLRYNAPDPRPLGGIPWLAGFADLTGDGLADLICGIMYTYESAWPETRIPADWGGIYCRPRVGSGRRLLFGDMIRLRYKPHRDSTEFFDFAAGYLHADVADLNRDGRPDLLFTTEVKSSEYSRIPNVHRDVHFFLHSGQRDHGGMPIFIASGSLRHPQGWWGPVRAVDLDGDDAQDLVFGSMYRDSASAQPDLTAYYVKNNNPRGWPFSPAPAVKLQLGRRPCFFDVDADGRVDSVCLVPDSRSTRLVTSSRLGWRKNQGGNPPQFGPAKIFTMIDLPHCYFTAASRRGKDRGILVSYDAWQRLAFVEQQHLAANRAAEPLTAQRSTTTNQQFKQREMQSLTTAVALGDQATPFPCDWDHDGDWDLLVGGGYGNIRIVRNMGTNECPTFKEVEPVRAAGEPIVIYMSQVFPGLEEYHHNMGYPHPAYVDWDGDGLPDLMVPNISNRIFWYPNIGTRDAPLFDQRQQVLCDGFPETEATRRDTARRLGAEDQAWKKRVADPNSPFGWRSRAGFGDFNGDGLLDLITADSSSGGSLNGYPLQSALFVQYRDRHGALRLRKDRTITLPDGTAMTNVAGQPAQAVAVDWNRDGLLDLLINHGRTMNTAPAVLLNRGSKTDPRFDFPQRLACWGEELWGIAKHGPYYGVGDLDGDGQADLLANTEMGTYHFFRRTALDMPHRPRVIVGPRITDP